MVVLEGESLFNDASALLVYRLAVGAATVGVLPVRQAVPDAAVHDRGQRRAGAGDVARDHAADGARRRRRDRRPLQFCGAFAVWITAEALHLSGILTVVVFAMTASRISAQVTPARLRIPSYAVWDFAVFVLNVLAFILVGFQLKAIIARLDTRTLVEYMAVAAAVCAATILSRLLWVSGAAAVARLRARWRRDGTGGRRIDEALSGRSAAVVGWCGMRGIVTLAAALGLPTGGAGAPGERRRSRTATSCCSRPSRSCW